MPGENSGPGKTTASTKVANPYASITSGLGSAVASGQSLAASIANKPAPATNLPSSPMGGAGEKAGGTVAAGAMSVPAAAPAAGTNGTQKVSTNQTIAEKIAAYSAANPAPDGFHYGETLGTDGKPILYKNLGTGSGSGASGAGGIPGTAGATPGKLDQTQLDAYATLELAFKEYGLDSLVPVIEGYMKNNIGPNQAALMIRNEQAYKDRFAGNISRVSNGLNALSEAQYLAVEDSYNETLNAYGLQNYFGNTAKARQAGMASIIGGDVSATEFQSRVKLAEDQVVNADPMVKQQLQAFYGINSSDLLKYYVDPAQNLAALTNKTLAAEIGAAAANQGLSTSAASAEALAKQGVTQNQAQVGYANIGYEMPVANKLNNIYANQGAGYNQADAEANQFNTAGAASAQRKREQLKQLEAANFSGRSGIVGASAAAGFSGSLGKSIQGKF